MLINGMFGSEPAAARETCLRDSRDHTPDIRISYCHEQGGQDSIHRRARTPLISAMVCELNQQLGAVSGMFYKCISQ
eukprot:COSAG02_NODE_800_length_17049_cov_14.510737_11_plen_77_part_00